MNSLPEHVPISVDPDTPPVVPREIEPEYAARLGVVIRGMMYDGTSAQDALRFFQGLSLETRRDMLKYPSPDYPR